MFVPRNEYEEMILLLLISEAMAVRDAVLSQSPEFKEARIHAFENATAIYDLLTVVVVRWCQVDLLYEVNAQLFKCLIEYISMLLSYCFNTRFIIHIINSILLLCNSPLKEQ